MSTYGPVMLVVAGWVCGPGAAQTPPEKEPAPALAVVPIARGEQREVQLCWDDGGGRAPAIFLLAEGGKLPEVKRMNWDGEPRFERNGLVVEHDKQKSAAVRKIFEKDGKHVGKQKGGEIKSLTVVALRVSAARDAKPGVQSVFVQVVTETGRSRIVLGEIRVAVAD